jgi:hypothetical protein
MADDKSKREETDRSRVANEPYEVDYFASKHGITREQPESSSRRMATTERRRRRGRNNKAACLGTALISMLLPPWNAQRAEVMGCEVTVLSLPSPGRSAGMNRVKIV